MKSKLLSLLVLAFLIALVLPVSGVIYNEKIETTNNDDVKALIEPSIQWEKTYGGIDHEVSYSVDQTFDGGYIITGFTQSFGSGNRDIWLIKTDLFGNELWNKTYGGTGTDMGYSVQQTNDGGYIITGIRPGHQNKYSEIWTIKTDVSGNIQWTKAESGSYGDDSGRSVIQTSDGGYIVAGSMKTLGAILQYDVYLVKYFNDGSKDWSKTIGGADMDDFGFSAEQTSDGGYIVTGWTESYGAIDMDMWLIKVDSGGNEIWNKTYGGIGTQSGYSVQQTGDNGYVIFGYTKPFSSVPSDCWLIKTDSTGVEIWNKTYGGTRSDLGNSVQQTNDGGYILTGFLNNDLFVIKTDTNGNIEWNKTLGGTNYDGGWDIQQTNDGGYIITGQIASNVTGHGDCWLIKLLPPNNPPNKPSKPSGPISGDAGAAMRYESYFSDQDGDSMEIFFDWGDGSDTGWIGVVINGSIGNFHSWISNGTYQVRTKARDVPYLQESDWSDPLTVNIGSAGCDLSIICPRDGIYLNSNRFFPMPNVIPGLSISIVIGDLNIVAEVIGVGVNHVLFTVQNIAGGNETSTDYMSPYEWKWSAGAGYYIIAAEAKDSTGTTLDGDFVGVLKLF